MGKQDDINNDSESPHSAEHTRAPSIGNFSPEEMEGFTLFEKKCVLINREIDSNGMGRYQWYKTFL